MSLREQLQAALGAGYHLDRELAGGGMSRVFVATEVALGRPVVVKVLHPELAAEVTAERFSREIQLAARLQQANIVPLLTAGHTGSLPFYTMPFVDGLSLRQRIAESGRLGIGETVGILRDVARALAYAHDAGVVHRDIKPENVLISGGAAVVTDFGIAKAITVARTGAAAATITQAGVGIGTPAYMAPEQAAGDPTMDHRADIYSFGCLAYELLTGHPPFRSSAPHELFAAHMTERPTPVGSIRNDVPVGLAQLVSRCLEKNPAQRPQGARELLDALDAVATPTPRASVASRIQKRGIFVGVSSAAVIFAIVLIVVLARRNGANGPAPAVDPSLAVLPFLNVGGDSAQDYLADGLSDELATAVGKIPGVRLAARSGTYRFRGRRDVDVREVGTALNVAYVVQGTVRQAGDQLRVSAQLTDAKSGVELWAQSFDRAAKDVFRTQDDIATAVSGALARQAHQTAPAAGRAVVRGTSNVEAYDLYLRGEFFLKRRQVKPAQAMFEQAIARDSTFARAYAGLSQALALSPYYAATPAPEVFDAIIKATDRALASDSALGEALMSRAMAYMHVNRWSEATENFERAVAADPIDVQGHFQFGRFLFHTGNNPRALAEWQRALDLDPFSALAAAWIAYLHLNEGRNREALAMSTRAMEYDSTVAVVQYIAARVQLANGNRARAVDFANLMPDTPLWRGWKGYLRGMAGDPAFANKVGREFATASPLPWFGHTAMASAAFGVGDTEKALHELELATDRGENWATSFVVSDALFDPVRTNPRWTSLLKRLKLEKPAVKTGTP